jgi:X-X-X-Leu-X-X-Gly heptad repeat protein
LFYYQGNFKKGPLPWGFSITYTLDGKKISGEKLAGQNGSLEITIKTQQNKKVNAVFYENYLLQVSVTLDGEHCKNMMANRGTLANAGDNKMITFTVMPGKDGDMTITTDVTHFEMAGISFAAVPFSMDMELPDTAEMTDDMTKLVDAIKELNDGVQKLDDGVIELNDGVIKLNDGYNELYDGIVSLNDGAKELKQGAAELNDGGFELRDGITAYKTGLNTLSDGSTDLVNGSTAILSALQLMSGSIPDGGINTSALEQLPTGLTQLAEALTQVTAGMTQLNDGYTAALTALKNSMNAIPDPSVSDDDMTQLQTVVGAHGDTDDVAALTSLIANYNAAQTVKTTYASVSAAFDSVSASLPGMATSIDTISSSLTTTATQVSVSLTDITAITQLTDGITALASQYATFHEGLVAYTAGLDILASGFGDIKQGIWDVTGGIQSLSSGLEEFVVDGTNRFVIDMPELGDGLNELVDGVGDLADGIGDLSEGTQKMRDETIDMPDEIQASIDELMADYESFAFTPVSFMSEQNEHVQTVQFIITSESINVEEIEESKVQEETKETFWTRLKRLFKKNKK